MTGCVQQRLCTNSAEADSYIKTIVATAYPSIDSSNIQIKDRRCCSTDLCITSTDLKNNGLSQKFNSLIFFLSFFLLFNFQFF